MSDKISGKFHPIPSTIANQRCISIRNIIIYLETKFRPNRRIVVFWWPFWIQNVCHSKSTMNINSLHHSLLGIQISPKSEDFCIWRPFCTLVTMVTAAILNFCNTSKVCPTGSDFFGFSRSTRCGCVPIKFRQFRLGE